GSTRGGAMTFRRGSAGGADWTGLHATGPAPRTPPPAPSAGGATPSFPPTPRGETRLPAPPGHEPAGAGAGFGRGMVRRRQGRHKEAIDDLTRAIKLKPGHAEAYFDRALAREGVGDRAGGIADYSECLQLQPTNASAWQNRGTLTILEGKPA